MVVISVLSLVSAVPLLASGIEGQIVVKVARDNANAVVYIDKIPGKRFTPPATPVTLDQVNLTFKPHVLAVLVGTTVAFPNSDEIRHNVFSPRPAKFDLGTYPRKEIRYHRFDSPGAATLLCNVHAEMSAYVIVAETPYFGVTEKDGKFTLDGVPPGEYILKVWHEKAKPATIAVTVSGSQSTILPPIELKR